ncbi:hypothetical protein NC652_022357 [Populus alba x Populus x berolinensis]|nr:hypothetical protein NC652_022357 [Populus alba x Populus x berolinensis]
MEVGQMQRAWVEYTKSLFREGFLDAQFQQLQLLQDESNRILLLKWYLSSLKIQRGF